MFRLLDLLSWEAIAALAQVAAIGVGIVTVAVGIGALVANVYVLRYVVKQTSLSSQQVLAATEQARAASIQAQAAADQVKEMRRARDGSVAPYLHPLLQMSKGRIQKLLVGNIGSGPALNSCIVLYQLSDDGQPNARSNRRHLFNIAPNDKVSDEAMAVIVDPREALFALILDGIRPLKQSQLIMVCEDRFGNRYRFRTDGPLPDEWIRASGQEQPPWAKWVETKISEDHIAFDEVIGEGPKPEGSGPSYDRG